MQQDLHTPSHNKATTARPSGRPVLDSRAIVSLVVWVLAVVLAGASVGLLFGPDAWFDSLAKPTWNPPSWLFGPVWTTLYALLGVAAWLVSREPGVTPSERRWAWIAFAAHAVFNLGWTPLFFGMREPGLAFVDICLVWLSLFWMLLLFGRIRALAGYLLLPQMLWVSFALVLNGTIWLMNT